MALYARGEDVPRLKFPAPQAGGGTVEVETQAVLGQTGWFVVASRPAGYHGGPHVHDAEQFNYVLDGECWIFVNEEAFLLKPGDFARVPANAIHWSWNRSDKPCTWVEVQTPAIRRIAGRAVPLNAEGEVISEVGGPPAFYVDVEQYNIAAVEKLSD
jgi:mannose-6-phosphate isomerase-like protein (cupin superfamily)